jgi:sporulation protein YlmC with PRC-barrel domain
MAERADGGGRVIDAGLQLLDRQILDSEGRMAGNVDDLEFTFPKDGRGAPIVTAIYAGPGALARRIGGRLGSWIESVHARLHPHEQPGPARIPFGVVKRIDNHIELSVPKDDLEIERFERWVRERIIDKIPGAADEDATPEGEAS